MYKDPINLDDNSSMWEFLIEITPSFLINILVNIR